MIISLFISLLFLIVELFRKRDFLSPILLFNLIWTAILSLYCLHIEPFISISGRTVLIIFLGILFWRIGAGIPRNYNTSNASTYNIDNQSSLLKSNLLYKILLFLMWYVLALSASRSIPYLLAGSTLSDVRYQMREDILGNLTIPFVYFAEPFSLLVLHFNAVRLFKGRHVKVAICSIFITVVLTELCIGGRFMLYFLGWDVLFIYVYSIRNLYRRKHAFRTKIIISLTLSLLIVAFVLITGADKVWDTIYSYTCGCVPLLEVKLQEFDKVGVHTLGFTSLNGFIRPIFTIIRSVADIPLPQLVSQAEDYLLAVEERAIISTDGGSYNGFVTLFYPFYIDAGYLGVVAFSFIWGFVCSKTYINFKNRGTETDIFIYLLIIQAISVSMTRFQFVTYQYALAYVYFAIVFLKNNK